MTPVLTATKMCLQWWGPRFVGASVKNASAYCDLLREFKQMMPLCSTAVGARASAEILRLSQVKMLDVEETTPD